jgi:hypothetical protein
MSDEQLNAEAKRVLNGWERRSGQLTAMINNMTGYLLTLRSELTVLNGQIDEVRDLLEDTENQE